MSTYSRLQNLQSQNEENAAFRRHQFIIREKEKPAGILYLQEGWASRYRVLTDGRRQITALFLPGDYCEPQWVLGGIASQSIVALTNIKARRLPCCFPIETREKQRNFYEKFNENMERQAGWLVTLGCKNALERVASLFVELYERLRFCGLTHGQQCAIPLTQTEIADVTGLTPVHVNRTLQYMREEGLVELKDKWMRIPSLQVLREAAALTASEYRS